MTLNHHELEFYYKTSKFMAVEYLSDITSANKNQHMLKII